LRLLSGDLREGFRQFERRHRKQPPGVQWTGQAIAGKTILIMGAEGGFGDDLQFCRYIPKFAERGGKVIPFIPRPLVRLFEPLPGVVRTIGTYPVGSPEARRALASPAPRRKATLGYATDG
jgi:hypothetical protein